MWLFSGYEAFAAVYLSPLIMGVSPIRRLVQSRWVMAVLRIVMVAALASFQVLLVYLLALVLANCAEKSFCYELTNFVSSFTL